MALTPEQEDHVAYIAEMFRLKMTGKYTAGAEEHGGNIWNIEVLNLVEYALDEAIDQVVYLVTLRQKLRGLV